MVNAQQWLDNNYPKEQRNTIKKLNIAGKDLEDELDLRDFVDLEELNCENNKLSGCLNLSNLSKLKILTCRNNKIEELKIENCRNITHLEASGNRQLDKVDLSHLTSELVTFISFAYDNLPLQDVSVFSRFINLETLSLGAGNNFCGSLESLKNLSKLKVLHIEGSDIDSGLEYLPASVEMVYCDSTAYPNPNNPNPRVVEIQRRLAPYMQKRWSSWLDNIFIPPMPMWRSAREIDEKQKLEIQSKFALIWWVDGGWKLAKDPQETLQEIGNWGKGECAYLLEIWSQIVGEPSQWTEGKWKEFDNYFNKLEQETVKRLKLLLEEEHKTQIQIPPKQ